MSEVPFEDLLTDDFDEMRTDQLGDLVGEVIVRDLARSARRALDGNRSATVVYVARYRDLTERLLSLTQNARPDLVSDREDTNGATQSVSATMRVLLDESATEAPFSRWAAAYGLERGIPLHALSTLRLTLPGLPALDPPTSSGILGISPSQSRRFLRAVHHSLDSGQPPLERIQDVFGVNATELGRLFGVSRQGVQAWMVRGLPAERQEKVATVAAVADLLDRKLKAERIPGVARRPADAYGGQSMLDMIVADRQQELLELTRHSFDWAQAA